MLEDYYFAATRAAAAIVESPALNVLLLILQVLAILVSFFLLAAIPYLLIKSNYYGPKVQRWRWFWGEEQATERELHARKLHELRHTLGSSQTDFRDVAFRAAQLFSEILAERGFDGMHLEDQLARVSPNEMPSKGHTESALKKLRMLQEDEDMPLSYQETEVILNVFELSLHELGAL
jgi:hypothetical protein